MTRPLPCPLRVCGPIRGGELKRSDIKLLRRVLETNGGGVQTYEFAGYEEIRFVPKAQETRLRKLGLIRSKPNHAPFIIHTDATRAAVEAADGRRG